MPSWSTKLVSAGNPASIVHPTLKVFWTVRSQGRQFGKPVGVGGGQVAAHGEQFALDLLKLGLNWLSRWMRGKLTNPCVELVQRPVCLDSQVVLADACTSKQAGATIVSCACVNAHAASYDGRAPARLFWVYLWPDGFGQFTFIGRQTTSLRQELRMALEWAKLFIANGSRWVRSL